MESFEIYLSSKNARYLQDNQTSNAYFTLPQIEINPKEETVYVNVKSATIPYSWYNVDSNNNTLSITFDGQLFPTIYTLTPSNYNINTLIEEIKTVTNLDTILYNKQTNKLTVTNFFDFTIHSTSTAMELIGFTKADHISSNGSLTSNIGINLYTTQQIIIKSNNFILNNISSKNHSDSNCLASIPVTGQPNSIIHYSNNTSRHLIHHLNNISNFHIKLETENGNQILLNGLHWTLTLEVFIKKNENIK